MYELPSDRDFDWSEDATGHLIDSRAAIFEIECEKDLSKWRYEQERQNWIEIMQGDGSLNGVAFSRRNPSAVGCN